MIEIKSLHKYFNKGKQNEIHVINDISLELPEKGMVAIFGKSGCGKTTLLNVIGGLDDFDGGELTVVGKDIRRDPDGIRNRYIGYIFQNYNLNKSESCFDNVADALRLCGMTDGKEIRERVMTALSNVDMAQYHARTPDTLSGGQQQRIAIARAIVKNPRIILADEPTGNLDETNTVMIMDLLKRISRDHLVLLVTHEESLVDYYCDRVIELSDGRVVNVRSNSDANGFSARDKHAIYLGELSKSALSDENAAIEYYGEAPTEPIKLRIVNHAGKLYVEVGTPKVQVLDATSEVRLCEGVYAEKQRASHSEQAIEMSSLPPVKGTAYGRLFTLSSSIKSGYAANFKQGKKSKRLLRRCMILFAAVLVFMTAVFGTAFDQLFDAQGSYNHNVFYVYLRNASVSDRLNEALGKQESGIDSLQLRYHAVYGDSKLSFLSGFFETFQTPLYSSGFEANAVFLQKQLARELPTVAGRKEGLSDEELLISTAVADKLLDSSTLGYIGEYQDLVGLITPDLSFNGKNMRIAGIVQTDETAVYMSEIALAKYVMMGSSANLSPASDFGIEVEQGKTVLAIRDAISTGLDFQSVGDRVMIHGKAFTVSDVRYHYTQYEEWLNANGIQKKSADDYFKELLSSAEPELTEGDDGYEAAIESLSDEKWFTYHAYYYDAIDAFLKDYYFFEPGDFQVWLAVEKGIQDVSYLYMSDGEAYYKAEQYRALYGRLPSRTELDACADRLPDIHDTIKHYYVAYESEFYFGMNDFYSHSYLLNEADYVDCTQRVGESHTLAHGGFETDAEQYSTIAYMVVHSHDPQKTEKWLRENFSELEPIDEFSRAISYPSDIFSDIIMDRAASILTGLIVMAVVLLLLSICMYFIMRSALLNSIKEVGIYRAIGVSKRNLVFKFFVEAAVLTTLTVFVGFVLTSIFISICFGLSPLVSQVFFYPPWLALVLLAVLYGICLLFGVLPILSLLRKTPSQILAKYDI